MERSDFVRQGAKTVTSWINLQWPWYIAGPIIGLFIPVLLTQFEVCVVRVPIFLMFAGEAVSVGRIRSSFAAVVT